jgi:UDP-N-acetylglucosamine--N-acetylmuramyl-(pentapeptide) pyrophosphoryl-undecaprenol N-acetylglucosamine transferase
MMSVLLGKPLVLHEQNSVAGLANKVLAGVADRIYSAFPDVLKNAIWVGNPLRQDFLNKPAPAQRFAGRSGPLKLWVVGGSLGAQALNDLVPKALALLPEHKRPVVVHQSGAKQIDALKSNYAKAGVQAELTPFIQDTAHAFAEADLIICRSGASTVTEIAAIGAAAIYVPFPFAVDDHQTTNANFLVAQGGGWLMPQAQLSAEALAERLGNITREELLLCAEKAWALKKTDATREVVAACEVLAA